MVGRSERKNLVGIYNPGQLGCYHPPSERTHAFSNLVNAPARAGTQPERPMCLKTASPLSTRMIRGAGVL
jgi:hypothetical protein